MGLFDKMKKASAPQATDAPQHVSTYQVALGEAPVPQKEMPSGGINLAKGESIMLRKTPNLSASCSWPPTTDYDVYAIVLYRDGHTETVSTFGAHDGAPVQQATRDAAVRHQGDVGRSQGDLASETIHIGLNPNILLVVPVVYSAQSNGTGSFYRHKVSMNVDNGEGQHAVIDARHALNDDLVYSCIPGVIVNTPEGARVEAVELYSQRGSEARPTVSPEGLISMDTGPRNNYK